jgi:hypothetical protein
MFPSKNFLLIQGQKDFPYAFFWKFCSLALIFRYLIHFTLVFIYVVIYEPQFIFVYMDTDLSE